MVITELQLHHVTGVRQFDGQLHVRGGQVRPVHRGIPALLQPPPLRQRRTGCHNVSPLS
ncbi:hypothetical protein OD591_004828 [Salmonella enterica]|nr:hypothetical protein [Salmonella enterica]EJF5731798.1 hypothetical protein [Salmonella enterica]EJX4571022.1 hypothetical protein [Salmonella enterica]EJX4681110.1 hypothetical protein [Salmonella enterica]